KLGTCSGSFRARARCRSSAARPRRPDAGRSRLRYRDEPHAPHAEERQHRSAGQPRRARRGGVDRQPALERWACLHVRRLVRGHDAARSHRAVGCAGFRPLGASTDGCARRLRRDARENIRRARLRDGYFKQELLKPRQVVTIPFSFKWIGWRIPAGARVRLVLMPLNSPWYQKNYSTGGRIGYEDPKSARVARITLLHDASRASALLLPLASTAR